MRPAREPVPEGLPLQQLGDEVRRALVDAEVVHGNQIGVVERAGESRLLLEPVDQFRVPGQSLVDDLEGDVTSEPGVPRTVDLGHSPGAEGREHLVRPKPDARS
jgi:hypothetical protein